MIRLIASDIDGTLLPYDETVMPQRLFPLIRRLRERNILFCPASGRQYHSMRTLFAPVADEMCFLCENGAVLYGPGTEEGAPLLSKTLLPRQEALALSRAIMDIPGCDVIIEGQNLNYLCGCGPELVHEMAVNHGNLVTMVDRPEDVPEEIVKIAAYCPNGMDGPAALLAPRWGLLAAAADGGVVYRGASSKSSACIQAACAVRRGSVPLGYVVADVTAAQLTALFDGQYTATSRLLLLDPFWDQVYASSDLPAKTLAARLRSQLLAGQALSDSHGAYDYFVRQEPRSGFCLVLQQPKPMTEGTAELMYLVAGLSLLLCLGLCVLASMRFSRQLFEPIRALNSAMREVEEGNLNVQLDNRRIDEMGQLSGRFNRMAQRLRQNLKDSLRQQRELNEAQIRMMQAQLYPHFLYNTLDTIKWMGKIHQAPEIATISADLADILRSSISADELVPLRQELRLVERYVEIQNIRFSGAFALTVEVDEPLRDVPVPKLMLQPLVENAILHGFRDRSGGEIRISAYRAEEDLILTVRDNGCGVPEEVLAQYRDGAPRPGGHFGLHNVDAILRIRYGPDRGVRFVPVQGEGACIRITLPVFRKGEEPPC